MYQKEFIITARKRKKCIPKSCGGIFIDKNGRFCCNSHHKIECKNIPYCATKYIIYLCLSKDIPLNKLKKAIIKSLDIKEVK